MKKLVEVLKVGVICVSMVSLVGCGASISIRSMKPAAIHLGQSPAIGITGVDGGRRNQQDAVVEELVSKSRSGGFFIIKDRKGEGIKFDIRNDAPVMTGSQVTAGPNDIFVSFKIVEIEAEKGSEDREKTREVVQGDKKVEEKYTVTVPVFNGNAIIAYTVVSENKVYMDQKEFKGIAKVDLDGKEQPSKDDVKEMALKNSVAEFLNAITPSYVTYSVNMDNTDKGQEEILAVARKGDVPTAKQRLETYMQTTSNAAANYNMAVLTEASGQYEAALELYNKAISMGSKPLYETAKSGCMQRINEQKALNSK